MKKEIADILREAADKIEKLQEEKKEIDWPYNDGDYIYIKSPEFDAEWIVKFKSKLVKEINDYWSYNIKNNQMYVDPGLWGRLTKNETHRPATPDEIALAKSYLPDGHPDKDWIPKIGDFAEVIDFISNIKTSIQKGDIVEAVEGKHGIIWKCYNRIAPFTFIPLSKLKPITNFQPKEFPKQLPSTIYEIVEIVKPSWYNNSYGEAITNEYVDSSKFPTPAAAEQSQAHCNVRNIVEWANKEFGDDGMKWIIAINEKYVGREKVATQYDLMLWQLMPFKNKQGPAHVISKPELLIHFKKLFTENK